MKQHAYDTGLPVKQQVSPGLWEPKDGLLTTYLFNCYWLEYSPVLLRGILRILENPFVPSCDCLVVFLLNSSLRARGVELQWQL